MNLNASTATAEIVTLSSYVSGGTWASPVSGSWANTASWAGGGQTPSSGTVVFAGTSATQAQVTLDGPQAVHGLQFGDGTGPIDYLISAGTAVPGSTLTLSPTAAGGAIPVAVVSGTHTISAPVVLAGSLAVSTTAGGSLDTGRRRERGTQNAGYSLTLSGGGELFLSGSDSYSGGTIIETGALIATSANALPPGGMLTVGARRNVCLRSRGDSIADDGAWPRFACSHDGRRGGSTPSRERWRGRCLPLGVRQFIAGFDLG